MEIQPLALRREQQMLKHYTVELAITNDAVLKGNAIVAMKADVAENIKADAGLLKVDAAPPQVEVEIGAADVRQEAQVMVTTVPTVEQAEAAKADALFVKIDADAIDETDAAVRLEPL